MGFWAYFWMYFQAGFWELVGWAAWSASFLNVGAMALQLKTIVRTQDTKSVSLGMMRIFAFVQAVFGLVGLHSGQWALFVGMLGSVAVTATIIAYVKHLRRKQGA